MDNLQSSPISIAQDTNNHDAHPGQLLEPRGRPLRVCLQQRRRQYYQVQSCPDKEMSGVFRRKKGHGGHSLEEQHACSGCGPAESQEDVKPDDEENHAESIVEQWEFPVVERDVGRNASLPRNFRFRAFQRRASFDGQEEAGEDEQQEAHDQDEHQPDGAGASATVVRQTKQASVAIKLVIGVIARMINRRYGMPHEIADGLAADAMVQLLQKVVG